VSLPFLASQVTSTSTVVEGATAVCVAGVSTIAWTDRLGGAGGAPGVPGLGVSAGGGVGKVYGGGEYDGYGVEVVRGVGVGLARGVGVGVGRGVGAGVGVGFCVGGQPIPSGFGQGVAAATESTGEWATE
jgi:hypothetical protein